MISYDDMIDLGDLSDADELYDISELMDLVEFDDDGYPHVYDYDDARFDPEDDYGF